MNNSSWLPSRRIVAFVIVPLCTMFLLWLVGYVRESAALAQADREGQFSQALRGAVDDYNTRDSDGDLLRDWEEFLYETDPYSPDTDQDGLDDYTEVIDPIRDPLVADAELGRYSAGVNGTSSRPYYTEDDSLNATEKFSRDIMNTFVQLRNNGSLGSSLEEAMIERVSLDVDTRETKQGVYTVDDILRSASDNSQAIDRYGVALAEAGSVLDLSMKSDLVLMYAYSEIEDTTHLEEIQNNVARYQQYIARLENIRVPSRLVEPHLALLNTMYVLTLNAETMARAETDPLGAMIAATQYAVVEEELRTVMQAIQLYLQNN